MTMDEFLHAHTAAGVENRVPMNAMHRMLDRVHAWQERARARRLLSAFDERALKDIGVSRADALREARKPFWRA